MTITDISPSDLEIAPNTSTGCIEPPGHLWAVLLAGGDGVRLRDLTRRIAGDSRPKQFCSIMGDHSLFRQTRTRLDPLFQRDRQVSVVSHSHESYYREELADASDSGVIEQPLNRGTGIAIAMAIVHILLRDPEAIVCFFPCDHYYSDDNAFRSTILLAAECGQRHPESIILLGAEAEYPEVDYGWIEPGTAILEAMARPLYRVRHFLEKPPLHHARALMRRGCLWNTFVTIGRASAFLDAFCSELPEVILALTRAVADSTLEPTFNCLPTLDFSRDVLAHQTHRLLVLRDQMSGWADLGSPVRVLDTLARNGIKPEWASGEDGPTLEFKESPKSACDGKDGSRRDAQESFRTA
jgi:mannose-1-phosphate guanylyltransferase